MDGMVFLIVLGIIVLLIIDAVIAQSRGRSRVYAIACRSLRHPRQEGVL